LSGVSNVTQVFNISLSPFPTRFSHLSSAFPIFDALPYFVRCGHAITPQEVFFAPSSFLFFLPPYLRFFCFFPPVTSCGHLPPPVPPHNGLFFTGYSSGFFASLMETTLFFTFPNPTHLSTGFPPPPSPMDPDSLKALQKRQSTRVPVFFD